MEKIGDILISKHKNKLGHWRQNGGICRMRTGGKKSNCSWRSLCKILGPPRVPSWLVWSLKGDSTNFTSSSAGVEELGQECERHVFWQAGLICRNLHCVDAHLKFWYLSGWVLFCLLISAVADFGTSGFFIFESDWSKESRPLKICLFTFMKDCGLFGSSVCACYRENSHLFSIFLSPHFFILFIHVSHRSHMDEITWTVQDWHRRHRFTTSWVRI